MRAQVVEGQSLRLRGGHQALRTVGRRRSELEKGETFKIWVDVVLNPISVGLTPESFKLGLSIALKFKDRNLLAADNSENSLEHRAYSFQLKLNHNIL